MNFSISVHSTKMFWLLLAASLIVAYVVKSLGLFYKPVVSKGISFDDFLLTDKTTGNGYFRP